MSLEPTPTPSQPGSAVTAPPADVFLQFLVNLVNNGGCLLYTSRCV